MRSEIAIETPCERMISDPREVFCPGRRGDQGSHASENTLRRLSALLELIDDRAHSILQLVVLVVVRGHGLAHCIVQRGNQSR